MKLRRVHLDGFGIFHGADLPALDGGLTIVEGANGAGKTTFLEFLRALLFGYDKNRLYEPLGGGLHGGWAEASLRDGRICRIARGKRPPAAGAETLACDGAALSIADVLPGVTRSLFQNVFAFDLDTLDRDSSLRDGDVQGRLHAALAGTGAIGLPGAIVQARKEAEGVFRQGGSTRPAELALQELERLRADLRHLQQQADDYDRVVQELSKRDDDLRRLAERETELEPRDRRLQALLGCWDEWVTLVRERSELCALPDTSQVPDRATEDLQRLQEAERKARENLDALVQQVHLGMRDRRQVVVPGTLLAQQAAVEELASQLSAVEQAARELPPDLTRRDQQSAELQRALANLGPGWTADRAEAQDVSQPARQEDQRLADELAKAERDAEYARKRAQDLAVEATAARQTAQAAEAALRAAYPQAPDDPAWLTNADAALEEARVHLAAVARAEASCRAAESERAARQDALDALEASSAAGAALSTWVAIALLVFGAVMAALSFKASQALAGVSLAVGAVTAIGWWQYARRQSHRVAAIERTRADRAAKLRASVDSAQNEAQAAASEAARAHTALGAASQRFGWHIAADEDAAGIARELVARRQRRSAYDVHAASVRDTADLAGAGEQSLARAADAASAADGALRAASAAWAERVASRGLPVTLLPAGIGEFLQGIAHVREVHGVLRDIDMRIAHRTGIVGTFGDRVAAVLSTCGRPAVPADRVSEAVRTLQRDLQDARAASDQRVELSKRIRQLGQQCRQERAKAGSAARDAEALLRAAGVPSDRALAELCRQREEAQRLAASIREREARLEGASGPGAARQRFEEELAGFADRQTLELEAAAQAEALRQCRADHEAAAKDRGSKAKERELLERSGEVADALRRREQLTAELHEHAAKWARWQLTIWLLEQARNEFEQAHQGPVLETASRHLERVTSGRCRRVRRDLDGDGFLAVAADGGALPANAWNRALREQVYLSVRFGYIEHYCRDAEPLPLVLDDVLANCDPAHTDRITALLLDIAREHQLLYLTCHPETIAMFRRHDPQVPAYRIADAQFVGV